MRIHRLLVANRGEIAVRVIRTCRALGIESVLGASDADLDSLPARLADKVVRLGPAAPKKSYLSVEGVAAAAAAARCDAVHPGYGFLAESAALARACDERGVVFVGPTPHQLETLSDKLQAREAAARAGLPVLPGGEVSTVPQAEALLAETGLPVLVKAVGGGGGRGMRLVKDKAALPQAIELAVAEAGEAFGDPRVYLERYVESGRHVEVQLLGDGTDVIHIGDRDCSVQRRYQKLVEEAPAPELAEELRHEMRQGARDLARELGYRGLGTVECLVDNERQSFYFLEVNPRIQVEHPVTEEISGLDLVAEQLAVAEGRSLSLGQEDVVLSGHAVECRINAEDPADDFRPSPGTARRVVLPAGRPIRVDTALQSGGEVPPYYDSLVAKVIASGPDRKSAIRRLEEALGRLVIEGIKTTASFDRALVSSKEFSAGPVDTGFLGRFLAGTDQAGSPLTDGVVVHG